MKVQGRMFRPKEKSLIGTQWDSTLEREISSRLLALMNGIESKCNGCKSFLPTLITEPSKPDLVAESLPTQMDVEPFSQNSVHKVESLTGMQEQVSPDQLKTLGSLKETQPSQSTEQQLKPTTSVTSVVELPATSSVEFHATKVPYVIQKTYNPDFTITYSDGKVVYIEAKGYFQDAQEIQKYDWIRDALSGNEELVFVFENPKKPIHFRSKRKDGTKMSHGEWADKLKFRHYTLDTMGELIT